MQSRRTFIKHSSLAATGILLSQKITMKNDPLIGLQLYTVRDQLAKDVEGTIAKVASIGFNSVEVFAYDKGKFFGKTPAAFSALLKQHHLQTPSGHYMMLDFLTKGNLADLKENMNVAAKMGHKSVVVPYLLDNMRTSLDDYKKLAKSLNVAGKEAQQHGMQLLYHNHNFEFKDWGGGHTGFDVLRNETDPKLVGFETDFYWITRAGLDPLAFIKANAGRIKQWHVKDMSKKEAPSFTTDGPQLFTEVGTGVINYKEIFNHKKESGMQYFFVEQDQTSIPVYDSIAKSISNLKTKVLA